MKGIARGCIGTKLTESEGRNSNGSGIWTKIMKRKNPVAPHFVVCLKNTGYPASLELHKIYRIVPDKQAGQTNDVRVIDESGDDYLYPASWFAEIKVPRPVERSFLHVRSGA